MGMPYSLNLLIYAWDTAGGQNLQSSMDLQRTEFKTIGYILDLVFFFFFGLSFFYHPVVRRRGNFITLHLLSFSVNLKVWDDGVRFAGDA
jgi:hypothetical protein